MKAIDLHIHTIKTIFDADFCFDANKLKEYIESENLECIAITNHNIFSKKNFQEIRAITNISVLPGIEISIEGGHLLVIGNESDVDKLEEQSNELRKYIFDEHSFLRYEEFMEIFDNYENYLLIPHYIKDPKVPTGIIKKFGSNIFLGEVSSAKKWFATIKKEEMLIPVLFSDLRIDKELKNFPGTHLYVDCDTLTVGGLKNSLCDRKKISLSKINSDSEFQIMPDGTMASLGLNVLIGKRSTGKTYTLDKINKSFEKNSIKYIQQFSIIKNADEKNFNSIINKENSDFYEKYLSVLKKNVNQALGINLPDVTNKMKLYLESLIEYANKQDKMDIFSKCTLFNEQPFNYTVSEEITRNIEAVDTLLSSKKYKNLVNKYIDEINLKKLLKEFIKIYKVEMNEKIKYDFVNSIIKNIKDELEENSAMNQIKDFNIINYALTISFVKKFNKYINLLKQTSEISKEDFYKFKIRATRKQYTSVQNIKSRIKNCPKITEEFKKYNNPYEYIHLLKDAGVPKNEIYKTIVDIQFEALNSNGSTISGGERAEYLLYNQIKDGENYDLILIDEPESSFDNIYLNENIKSLITNISKKTTTFIVTHNHILGVMLKADKILYTCYENGEYKIYTGNLSSKKFLCVDGKEKTTHDIILDTMEAGQDSYIERSKIYENIEN